MTAAAYSARRSEISRGRGLGQKGRTSSPEASEASEEGRTQDAAPAKRRGRPPNASKAPADA